MNDNNHILKEDFQTFLENRMNQKDKVIFLEHICSCTYCSEQLAALMSENVISAPKDLKENILKATKRPEVQFARKAKETSKRMQLLLYSLKVGTATIGALLLLLLTMNLSDFTTVMSDPVDIISNDETNISLTSTIRDSMDTLSNSMLDFSNNIMKTEVTINDQKEK